MEVASAPLPIKLFQWNVLTQAFCNHSSYPSADYPQDALDEDERRPKVLAMIGAAMQEERIIVLHEVDQVLRGHLAVLAEKQNYGYASQGHGYWKNWYMGSAILWPRSQYTLKALEYISVGDMIKRNQRDPALDAGWYDWVMSWFYEQTNYYRKAIGRSNILIHATLAPIAGGDSGHIWAYHMPCSYKEQPIMWHHAEEVCRIIREDADRGRHYLCMDGNFLPDSCCYDIFTDEGFQSTALLANGTVEPPWTCHSNSTMAGAFTGTLDYVWYIDTNSSEIRSSPTFCLQFAEVQSDAYLPTVDFPSDHLWMKVDATIENKE